MAERNADAGFSIVEVVICVALLVAACVAGLGVVPTLARASQRALLRDAALSIANAALDRARAATAYYPAGGAVADHAYALAPSATYATGARVHRDWCGANRTPVDITMDVALAYDAANDRVTATVHYPRDPCGAVRDESVVLGAQLGPSALVPGSLVTTPIGDPAQQ